ncbi:hypothetical protein J583_0823 [Acinetobacter baumannii 83444]|nr:hypothetical protein J462_0990 [Acinetobacter baumannii 972082]EXE80829.1 hypothetical protein J583_0823 [Acinetobacter baumannii 83444]KJG91861.1 hypothetical protein QU96_2694 [Acinetobacter baumannii]
MADQLSKLNSGFECLGPSLISPYREQAMKITNTIYSVAASK